MLFPFQEEQQACKSIKAKKGQKHVEHRIEGKGPLSNSWSTNSFPLYISR
jgi:hypothetical protein